MSPRGGGRARKEPLLIVLDPVTRRTGVLVETPGYVMGTAYVAPGLRIEWDRPVAPPVSQEDPQ
jgi:hypothetical protein